LPSFDRLRLPDVEGSPSSADACGQWSARSSQAVFGSWDPVTKQRWLREFFLLSRRRTQDHGGAALMVVRC